MTDNASYQLPDHTELYQAMNDAMTDGTENSPWLARVMCTVTAAAVRDILTDHGRRQPFDAVALELVMPPGGSLTATGGYWTASGRKLSLITGEHDRQGRVAVWEMDEWVGYLDRHNEAGWRPLCTVIATGKSTDRTVYRLDLVKAAALPRPDAFEPTAPDAGPDSDREEVPVRPGHERNCPGGCSGHGYRYCSSTAEDPEPCTGRPYRFVVRALDEDTGRTHSLLGTDDETEVAQWADDEDPNVWVQDRDYVPAPPPVSLVKYDAPF